MPVGERGARSSGFAGIVERQGLLEIDLVVAAGARMPPCGIQTPVLPVRHGVRGVAALEQGHDDSAGIFLGVF
jgi:hypothetical protein